MKVYIVDNGGQWTHREWRVLRDLADARMVRNDTPPEDISDADALVLSGGAPGSVSGGMGRNSEYLEMGIPVLGICAGMQFTAVHFGGAVGPGEDPEYGSVTLKITDGKDLFRDIPDGIEVWASHNDEVKSLPEGFEILAYSERCGCEAMRCSNRPIFGVQFHPEADDTQYGCEIFQNFLDIASKY